MALVIAGRIVPLDPRVTPDAFDGRVYIGNDGRIDTVTKKGQAGPTGFKDAPVVDVGASLVLPGFIDLHNHLGYNMLPLWTEPKQKTPWKHHDSWPGAPTYSASIHQPAQLLAEADPEAMLAYVQLRALAGGTAAIQGWPTANRPHVQVLRNVDAETAGGTDRNLIYTSALTKDPDGLREMAQAENKGAGFIYHCAEGQAKSLVQREFTDASLAGCLRKTFIGIHCNAIGSADWKSWAKSNAGAVVWSPFSNLWLYGSTTNVMAARAQNVKVCLGSDWGPSGTKNVLGEVKVAKLAAKNLGYGLQDRDFVDMLTCNPGDVLGRCWGRSAGRLVAGGFGDVTVLRVGGGGGSIWSKIVSATERDVVLVVVGGIARYGDAAKMTASKVAPTATITVAGKARRYSIPDPADPKKGWAWSAITGRIDKVRKNPKAALKHADAMRRAYAGPLNSPRAPLELVLDMPTGGQAFAGPLKHPETIVVPPLPTLVHDAAFFAAVKANPFHGGVLDGLKGFYK